MEVRLQWPPILTDTLHMHKLWLSESMENGAIQLYHPKIGRFKNDPKVYRARKTPTFVSTPFIDFPVTVQTNLEEAVSCMWQDPTHCCLYITMRGASDCCDDQWDGL